MVLSSSEQLSCHPELLCSDITVPDLQGYAHLLTAKHPTNAAKNMVYCRKMDLPQFRKILAQCRDTKAVAAGDIEKLTSHFGDGDFISKAWSEIIRHFQMPQKVHNEMCQQIKGGMFPSRAKTPSINRTYHNVTTKNSARFCPPMPRDLGGPPFRRRAEAPCATAKMYHRKSWITRPNSAEITASTSSKSCWCKIYRPWVCWAGRERPAPFCR